MVSLEVVQTIFHPLLLDWESMVLPFYSYLGKSTLPFLSLFCLEPLFLLTKKLAETWFSLFFKIGDAWFSLFLALEMLGSPFSS